MTYHVYILTNANKNLIYIGVTNNLIRRVYEHKHHLDKGSYTARYNIDQLVYFEETSDVEAAISREKQLKVGIVRERTDWSNQRIRSGRIFTRRSFKSEF